MSSKLIDIAFLIGSGRVNADTEWQCFAILDANGMSEFVRLARAATESQINDLWAILKATPAGQAIK